MLERRQDRDTAKLIIEALRMKTAFGYFSARKFLRQRDACQRAILIIGGRYDPRQKPS